MCLVAILRLSDYESCINYWHEYKWYHDNYVTEHQSLLLQELIIPFF